MKKINQILEESKNKFEKDVDFDDIEELETYYANICVDLAKKVMLLEHGIKPQELQL